jgi:hypothetical protein
MSDEMTVVLLNLARLFYEKFRSRFAAAAIDGPNGAFHIMVNEFDAFLVELGLLPAPANDYPTGSIERDGITSHRTQHRKRLNAAAHEATEHPQFHVSAPRLVRSIEHGGRQYLLLVKLIERYAKEEPAEIMQSFSASSRFYGNSARKLKSLVIKSPEVSPETRMKTELYTGLLQPMMESLSNTARQWVLEVQGKVPPKTRRRGLGVPAKRRITDTQTKT